MLNGLHGISDRIRADERTCHEIRRGAPPEVKHLNIQDCLSSRNTQAGTFAGFNAEVDAEAR